MSDIPSLSYIKVVNSLKRLGFIVVRQKGSHIRMQKRDGDKLIKLTVPAHKPIKVNTLRHILKQSGIDIDQFKSNL